jgi:hypothetical protein
MSGHVGEVAETGGTRRTLQVAERRSRSLVVRVGAKWCVKSSWMPNHLELVGRGRDGEAALGLARVLLGKDHEVRKEGRKEGRIARPCSPCLAWLLLPLALAGLCGRGCGWMGELDRAW